MERAAWGLSFVAWSPGSRSGPALDARPAAVHRASNWRRAGHGHGRAASGGYAFATARHTATSGSPLRIISPTVCLFSVFHTESVAYVFLSGSCGAEDSERSVQLKFSSDSTLFKVAFHFFTIICAAATPAAAAAVPS